MMSSDLRGRNGTKLLCHVARAPGIKVSWCIARMMLKELDECRDSRLVLLLLTPTRQLQLDHYPWT
jgi:hypothetical protein